MTQNAAQLLAEALRLPENERGDLATHLIDSLDPIEDADVEAAWGTEIKQRIEDLRNGKVKPLSWTEALRMILEEDDGIPPV